MFALHVLCVSHILFWAIVLLAPLLVSVGVLPLILFGLIPLTILVHGIFPLHIIEEAKKHVSGFDADGVKVIMNEYESWGAIEYFTQAQRYCHDNCFQSPLSPQGMLLISSLICSWRLTRGGRLCV